MKPDPVECIGDCGPFFVRDASTTWQSEGQNWDADYSAEAFELLVLEMTHLGYWEASHFRSDYINLRQHNEEELILEHEAVAGSADDYHSIGSLGLAPQMFDFTGLDILQPSTMRHSPGEHHMIGASYGYTAGAIYKEEPVYGSLTLRRL